MTRIVCHQLAPVIGEMDRNCETIVTSVTSAVATGADVVVLPELATSGYVFESLDEARSLAITADHDVFARVAQVLAGSPAVAVFGFCERGQGGLVHNSAAVVTADGVLVCYDLEFAEITRHLAVQGADLITVPTNWPLGPRPDGERPVETIIAMAAARTNRVVIACCDRTEPSAARNGRRGPRSSATTAGSSPPAMKPGSQAPSWISF